jgi:hypothetical protein
MIAKAVGLPALTSAMTRSREAAFLAGTLAGAGLIAALLAGTGLADALLIDADLTGALLAAGFTGGLLASCCGAGTGGKGSDELKSSALPALD